MEHPLRESRVRVFASYSSTPKSMKYFIDDREGFGVLTVTRILKIAQSPQVASIYVRAYARNSVAIPRVYGLSQTLDVNNMRVKINAFCGIVKGPPARVFPFLLLAVQSLSTFLGIGPSSAIFRSTHAIYPLLIHGLITMACSWYDIHRHPGHPSTLRKA